MGTVPTARLTGLDGQVLVGATSGASDVYAAADMRDFNCTITADAEDLTALSDDWAVEKTTTYRAEGSVGKFINTTPEFISEIISSASSKEAVYLTFKTSAGTILTGLFNITSVGIQNPRGAVLENVSFRSSGAVAAS